MLLYVFKIEKPCAWKALTAVGLNQHCEFKITYESTLKYSKMQKYSNIQSGNYMENSAALSLLLNIAVNE